MDGSWIRDAGRTFCVQITDPGRPRTNHRQPLSSYDHLVRAQDQRLRYQEPEGPRGFEVDDEIQFRGLLDRQIAWLGAFEDLVNVGGGPAIQVGVIWAIRDQC